MATQFSDIYINGITTEELHADGGQIVEAWLNGECIWRLVEGPEKAKHIVIWTRLDEKYYGFGLYLHSQSYPYNSWQRIFFSGINVEEMVFNIVEVGKTDDAFFQDYFKISTPVSVYDFGFCIFKGIYQPAANFPNVSVILVLDVHSTAGENTAELAEVLGESYVNISDPLGMCSNVFNNRYQIRGSNHYEYVDGIITYGFAEIYDLKNKNIIYAYPSGEDNTLAYRTGMCAKMLNKVFFVPWDNSLGLYVHENIPLYYIELSSLYTVKKMDIDIQKYLEADTSSKSGYNIYHVRGTGIDSDNKKIVFGLQIQLISLETLANNIYKNILVKYENGILSIAEQQADLLNRGCKIVGSYIVLTAPNGYTANAASFLAGKSIDKMTSFLYRAPQNNEGRPHCFYEENGELYYDEIYTHELLSSQEPVSSVVRKNRVDFELGKIIMESEIEINGKWEE